MVKSKIEEKEDRLKSFKRNVDVSGSYFKKNVDRFWEFKNFTQLTSVSAEDRAILDDEGKPDIEFNTGEALVSRLMGEFSKQQPSISVKSSDDLPPSQETAATIETVEGHVRHIINECNKDNCENEIYADQMLGGYAVLELYTKYVTESPNSLSAFNQAIGLRKAYDSTLCGFDPLAMLSHKGDGRYCFKLSPMTEEEFKEEFPKADLTNIKFTGGEGAYKWSYAEGAKKVILVCDYYYKKIEKVEIYKVAKNDVGIPEVVTAKEYKEVTERVLEEKLIVQLPVVINKRMVTVETIHKCRFVEDQILEETETDFPIFPLIFVDGNSAFLRKTAGSPFEQVTRPYLYHAKGVQKLKNYAGQSLAQQIEDIQRKDSLWAQESLPDHKEYLEAVLDGKKPGIKVYKSINEKTGQPIPPPISLSPSPIPPEISNTFMACDQTLQNILGSYDAALGINNNQLSGVAIVEGATQSNAAAMPYIVNFMQGLNRASEGMVKMIPKYYVTPRTIPVMGADNKSSFQLINQSNGVNLQYPENALQVTVEVGVNSSIQKNRDMEMLLNVAKVSPSIGGYLGSEFGAPIIFRNLNIHGVDQMEIGFQKFIEFQKQQQQQQMQMQQQAMQNNPAVQKIALEKQKLQQMAQQNDIKNQLDISQQRIEEMRAENDRMKLMLQAKEGHINNMVQLDQHQTEKEGKAWDYATQLLKESHKQHSDERKHNRDDLHLIHNITKSNQTGEKQNESRQ